MPGLDWSLPWLETLHSWNLRVREFTKHFYMQSWAGTCLRQHWQLAHHVSRLHRTHAWVRQTLDWSPQGVRNPGRPQNTWSTQLEAYARTMRWRSWMDHAANFRERQLSCDALFMFAQQPTDAHFSPAQCCRAFSPHLPAPQRGCLMACRLHLILFMNGA